MILKSNKFLRYGFILLSLLLFAFVVIKAYDEYLFQINNRTLKKIIYNSPPYRILPVKTVNHDAEVEKIISDFVSDNKYDTEPEKPLIVKQENIIPKKTESAPTVSITPSVPDKNILTQEENIVDLKKDGKQNKDNLLQLGAYNNKENISSQVRKLKLNFPLLLKDKKFFVKSSKKSLYKLFIGPFKNSNEAKEFCSTLRKNGVSCFFVQF